MFHRWAALLLVLALCAMSPKTAAGQATAQPPRGQKSGSSENHFRIPSILRLTFPSPSIQPAGVGMGAGRA